VKPSRFLTGLAGILCAALAFAGASRAEIPTSVSLSDVYGLTFPTSVPDPATAIIATEQTRALAVNNNPGSPWKGTLYLPRRGTATAAAGIFYWKAESPASSFNGTLKTAGPDLAQSDGHWTMPAGFEMPANGWWSIAVADDDYVYVAALAAGKLYRLNPDLTDITLVSTEFATQNLRAFQAYGKGIDTEIWYNLGTTTNGAIVRLEPTAVDEQGRPIGFVKTLNVAVGGFGGQHSQGVPNSTRDTYYLSHFDAAGSPFGPAKISLPGGVKDTAFPEHRVYQPHGAAIDSNDRVVYALGHTGIDVTTTNNFGALHPITGANLSDPANFRPVAMTNSYLNFMQLARYSDRHYFYTAIGSNAANPNVMGVIATDVPAPAPRNVRVKNLGTGTSLELSWTPADDPEVTGVIIYRSETAGSLGTALNTTPIAATTYTDNSLTAGKSYYYTLASQGLDPFTGSTYPGDPTTQLLAVPMVLQIPAAPTGVAITDTAQGGELEVKWTTPALYAEQINIYRSETAGQLGSLVKEVLSPTANAEGTWLDTGLTNRKTYYYTVRAANVVGESGNTQQYSGVATDTVAPTFAGIKSTLELGFPGYRLSWDAASDKSGPITYNVYTGPSADLINYNAPVGSITGQTIFDLTGMIPGQEAAIAVRAEDSSGNEEANAKVALVLPTRVIVDPDLQGGANRDKFNPQPDPAFPALGPEGAGGSKGNAPDLVAPSFGEGAYYFQTNDKLAKSGYTIPIPVAGNYDISAWWTFDADLDTPNYTFRITYPNGTTENVVVDMKAGTAASGGNGAQWNLLVDNKDLTSGTMTIIGDATTSTSTDPTKINVSSAIRALLNVTPSQVTIYTAATPPTIDGVVNDAEWAGSNVITLGKAYQDVVGGNWTGAADYTSRNRLLWNGNGLFIAGVVTDDVLSFKDGAPTASYSFWDSMELYLGIEPTANPDRTTYNAVGDYQILITGYREGGSLKGIMAEGANRLVFPTEFGEHEIAFTQIPGGYSYEAYIPWTYMVQVGAIIPSQNQIIGFNLQGIDNDTVTELNQQSAFSLSTKGSSWQNPQSWIKALLAGAAPARPRGDVNLDGRFDGLDVAEALRIAGGLASVGAEGRQAGDVYGNDSKISLEDVAKMQTSLLKGVAP